jgi:glycosyltransferase involved in cell wall biosynthesis
MRGTGRSVSLLEPGDAGRPRADMRVLHVVQEMAPGGAEAMMLTLADGSRAAGDEVAVAAAPGPLAGEFPGPVFPLPMVRRRAWLVPKAASALRTAVRRWRPDLVQAYNPGMAVLAALATRRGARPRAFVVVHGLPEEDYERAARLLRWAGLPVLACGPGVAAGLEDAGCPVMQTITNGVSAPPRPVERAAFLRECRLPSGPSFLVCVGRLAPIKNQALAVVALAGVPDAVLAIVGEGAERRRLEDRVRWAGLGSRVVFTGYRSDARAIMGAADIVVLPSRSEGLPGVALEALAAGRPLVATAVRGNRELLDDGRTALLVAPDDPEAMAGAIRRILEDPALAERLGTEGRREAARYSVDAMVRRYLELYRRLAS